MLKVSGLTITDKSEHSEQVKKLLKHAVDIGRKIEEKHQSTNRVEDVFSVDLLTLRSRMKDLLMKMLLLDPKKSGAKVFEHYWRKCYHEPYSVVRQFRGNGWSKHQAALIQSHLLSGIGTYHNMILFLTETFGWDSEFMLDFSIGSSYGWTTFGESRRSYEPHGDQDIVEQAWVEAMVFRCLVWLGDLARYLETDMVSSSSATPTSATRYYRQATQLNPSSGQPFNNLAMLEGGSNHGLNTLYLYLKCVCCKTATENGKANLTRLLQNTVEFGADPGHNLMSGLMQLVKVVFEGGSQESVTVACQHSLAYLHQCLENTKDVSEAERKDVGLSGSWLCLTVSVVILLIQHKAEPVCQAWMMAIMSHLAGNIVSMVLDKYPDLEVKEMEEIVEVPVKEETVKKRKNKLENMLRRRRKQSGSEGEDSEESSDEILESDDCEDDEDDDNSEDDEDYLVDSSSSEDEDVIVEEEEKIVPSQRDLLEMSNQGEQLQAFILCYTWLKQHPHLLAQTGHGSEQMWTNLTNIFNVLNLASREELVKSDEIQEMLENDNTKSPLPEDWMIRGHNQEEDTSKTWSSVAPCKLPENVLRLKRVEQFRDWLCGHADSKITFDKGIVRARKAVEESDKKNVMKHMAELWLKQEVKDLEKEAFKEVGFIILDSKALVTNLAMVKRTLGLKRFPLVVPNVVVQQLDGLKKAERGAREAIRWLERELSRGNRWLRAQKPDETVNIDNPTNATKQQLQLLQCVQFFVNKSKTHNIIFLTGDNDIIDGDMEMFGEAKENVRVENVEGFVSRVLGGKNDARARKRRGRGRKRRDSDNAG